MFRFIVLGLLRHGEPRHGYALIKAYRARSGRHVAAGSFYRELANLVSGGLARQLERGGEAGDQRSRYEITPLGRQVFDGWLYGPISVATAGAEDDIAARALFLGLGGGARGCSRSGSRSCGTPTRS